MWKLQYVFKRILPNGNYNSSVILLEEDYYVSPDILTTNAIFAKEISSRQLNVDMISLGNYDEIMAKNTTVWSKSQSEYSIRTYYGSEHNLGLSFTRKTFDLLNSYRSQFCTYNDYNWDWTLQYLSNFTPHILRTLAVISPRVYHIGNCKGEFGAFHDSKQKTTCKPTAAKEKFENFTAHLKQVQLNPTFFSPIEIYATEPPRQILRPYGGWDDPRDHQLCMNYGI